MNSNHYSCERPEHGWGTPPMLIKTFGVIIMRQPAKNKHQTSVCFSIESTGSLFEMTTCAVSEVGDYTQV